MCGSPLPGLPSFASPTASFSASACDSLRASFSLCAAMIWPSTRASSADNVDGFIVSGWEGFSASRSSGPLGGGFAGV